jgi:two-component system, cell cycle sensor histidine kinase and response regulator CckA
VPYNSRGLREVNQEGVRTALVTILFADSAELIRRLMCPYLRAIGYEVLEAADEVEAIAVASQCSIDLLISDVTIPGLNGLALARRLTDVRPGIKVLFISSDPGDLKPGVAFLRKPFAPKSLVRKVADVLGVSSKSARG